MVMRTHGPSSSLMPSGVATRDHTASHDADSREETRKPITGDPRREATGRPPARRYRGRAVARCLADLAPARDVRVGRTVALAREAALVGRPVAEPVVAQTLLVQLRLLLMDLGLRARPAGLALGELGALFARVGLDAMLAGD